MNACCMAGCRGAHLVGRFLALGRDNCQILRVRLTMLLLLLLLLLGREQIQVLLDLARDEGAGWR